MPSEHLLDAAYQLAKNAHTANAHVDAKEKLQGMYPTSPWNEILDAYLKGCELAEKCYEIADTARRERIPDQMALQTLVDRFPGFSARTYNYALTLGWFLSR